MPLTCLPASSPRKRGEERLPPAAAPFLAFARLLRRNGFTVAPEQAIAFMQSVQLLGPRSMEDIRQAAYAALGPEPDHLDAFEALFRAHFYGDVASIVEASDEEETAVKDDSGGEQRDILTKKEEGGELASSAEALSTRDFKEGIDTLASFQRALGSALPCRRSFRWMRTTSRGQFDLRRSLREIVQADGDVAWPLLRRRKTVQRNILLLIDVSGSMRLHTADYLQLAHAVVQGADRAEIFTFGTRLTRITPSLRLRDRDRALARAASLVEDWDGGTRIGPTLLAFLSVPRFAGFARNAAILILSDGLERGDHAEMETAIRRLKACAFRLSLATPLAGDPRFRPRTAALKAVLPYLDDLVDGSSIERLTAFILSLARPAPAAAALWRQLS
ncbi:VWA domain-containing protein [Pseudaminobacter sp. 19-2017]|uniref:VWA domain-containing protein n=1 Tax=Pseudaminobacter soli (ex Zhang et al. 2022) TaxID=2831468 RepID=A0A942I366_9HYPH|nr:VWA domain-containing protein [Pseudaminobacter soli]MBS3649848.1 VWA domain-containing protein [Pseudaminobacter soli]